MHDDNTLWRYLDGELDPTQARNLRAAIEADPELSRRIEDMKLMSDEVLAGAPEPDEAFADRVLAASRAAPAAEVLDLEQARRVLKKVAIAAAILAAVSLTYLGFRMVPEFIEPAQAGSLLP